MLTDIESTLTVNQTTLATIFGISQPQVVALVRKGMPRIEGDSQKQTKYSLPECVKWYIDYKSDIPKNDELREAQIRKTNLESDRIELELAEKRKTLIEIVKVASIWGNILQEFKTKLLLIPKRAFSLFDSFDSPRALEDALTGMIHESLENLSRAEYLTIQAVEKS